MVAFSEAKELALKGFLTSSCCPAFVNYIEKSFPQLKENISHNFSPMAEIARYIKETTPKSPNQLISVLFILVSLHFNINI